MNTNFLQKKRYYFENTKYKYQYYLLYKFEINLQFKQILYKKKITSDKYFALKKTFNALNIQNCPKNTNFIVYGNTDCKYCSKVIELLINTKKNYCYVNIKTLPNKQITLIQKFIKNTTNNYQYIPVIFYNGVFIGGYDDLKIFLKRYQNPQLSYYNKNDIKMLRKINK
jgi:glutaredoxin|tara:strand:- start:17469 stop:17975 length:507 start_codon:yes stop_codon:yes gene_type:complete